MMPYKILDDYKSEKTACRELISTYQDKLPEQVIAIWEEYGLGSFMNGFIKTVDPGALRDLLQRVYFNGLHSIPVFVTAMGDMIIWEDNAYLTILRLRHGTFAVIGKGCSYFLDDLTDEDYVSEFLKPQDYYIALRTQGHVKYDECFEYVPLLCLGGAENAKNLKKAKLLEHMELILAVSGPVT